MTKHRDKFLVIKPTRCTNFSNLFWKETLHVSDGSSAHHQEFFTVHTTMVYVIQVSWQLASRIRMELSSILILFASYQLTCMTYTIAVCAVKNSWWWTEELSETYRVSFQNKFEKLVDLVGFIIRSFIINCISWDELHYKHSCCICCLFAPSSDQTCSIVVTFFVFADGFDARSLCCISNVRWSSEDRRDSDGSCVY